MTIRRISKIILFIILAAALAYAIPALYDALINRIALPKHQTAAVHCPSDHQATLYDRATRATLILYKDPSQQRFVPPLPLRYTMNIKAWFDNPTQARIDQGYEIRGSKKYFLTKVKGFDPVLLHAFSPDVDQYVPCWANQSSTPSKKFHNQQNIALSIAGIIIDKHNKKIYGSFTYFFDAKSGVCYHRFFKPSAH